VILWTNMPWLEDLKFPRGYQMGTHIILKFLKFVYNKVSEGGLLCYYLGFCVFV